MIVLLWTLAGALGGRLVWLGLAGLLEQPAFARVNHRGRSVPVGGGLAPMVTFAALAATAVLLDLAPDAAPWAVALALVGGLGALGLLDDLAGEAGDSGFAGHLGALRSGRLTTGALKLVGGAAVALVACSGRSSGLRLVADAALVALAANLANLFDHAPGRCLKVSALAWLALAITTLAAAPLAPVAAVVGAAMALFPEDLGERVMLGDTGANLVGGTLGLGVVIAGSPLVRGLVLAGVVGLNLASETVSFSAVIERVPALRFVDRLGRSA